MLQALIQPIIQGGKAVIQGGIAAARAVAGAGMGMARSAASSVAAGGRAAVGELKQLPGDVMGGIRGVGQAAKTFVPQSMAARGGQAKQAIQGMVQSAWPARQPKPPAPAASTATNKPAASGPISWIQGWLPKSWQTSPRQTHKQGSLTPTAPASPVAPQAPQAKVAPQAPRAPVAPTASVAPTAPIAPTAPTAPVAPTAPTAPVAPTAPPLPGGNSPPAGNNPAPPAIQKGGLPDDIANLLRVGAIGHFTNKTIDAGVALALLPKKLKDFGAAVVESKRNFSELNFKMAATFTRLDAERLGRNVKLAAGTSGTTQDLAKAQSKFEEKLLPYATASINILNKILEAVLGTASNFPDFLKAGLSAAFPFLAGPIKDSIDGAKAAINGTTAAINSQKNNDDRATTDALRKMVMGLADKIGDRKRPPMKSAPPMAMPGAHRRSGGGFGA